MMSVCTVLLKLLASVSSIGNSALTSTFSVVDPTFNLASTRIAWAERTSMPVMSSEVNPLTAKCARYAPGIKASALPERIGPGCAVGDAGNSDLYSGHCRPLRISHAAFNGASIQLR